MFQLQSPRGLSDLYSGVVPAEIVAGIGICWIVASLMCNAFEFRDVLIYLWPGHL